MMKWLLVGVLTFLTVDAAKIDCVFTIVGNRYECDATVSHKGVPALDEVTGTMAPGKTLSDVDDLYIRNQNLAALPRDLGYYFDNLKAFEVNMVPIRTISADDFQGMAGLKFIYLKNVKLTSVPGDLFANTPKLVQISISSNPLEHIGANLLTSLRHLIGFDLKARCLTYAGLVSSALFADLAAACPPLESATTTGSPSTPPTIPSTGSSTIAPPLFPPTTCACDQKIEKLQTKIENLKDHEKADIAEMKTEAKAVEKRLKALEKHLSAFCTSLASIL